MAENTTMLTLNSTSSTSGMNGSSFNISDMTTGSVTMMITELGTKVIQESTTVTTLSELISTTAQSMSTSVFENTSMNTNVTGNASDLKPSRGPSGACFALNSTKTDHVDALNTHIYRNIYLPSLILTIILFIVGTPGNIIVFYVYLRKWRKTTSRIFIIALAGFDLVNCVIMPFEMAIITHIVKFDYPGICKISRFLTFMMNNCSSFTLLIISMDRYIRICSPLKTPISNRQAKTWIGVSVVIAIIFSWPAGVLYGTLTFPIPSKFPGVCIVANLCLIENQYRASDYPLYFTTTLLAGTLLIDFVLIVCYTCIAYRVIQRGAFDDRCKCRKDSMNSASTENDVLDDSARNSPIVIRQLSYNLSAEAASKINAKANGSKDETTPLENQLHSQKKPRGSSGKKNSKKRQASESSSFGGSVKAFISRRGSESGSGGGSVRGNRNTASRRLQFQKQRSMSSQSIESRRSQMYKTTLMLFLVTLLFIVSFVPYCVIVIMRYINPLYYDLLGNSGKAVYQFFLRTYLLSSSLNPLIYSFLSEQFRTECKTVICNVLSKVGCRKC